MSSTSLSAVKKSDKTDLPLLRVLIVEDSYMDYGLLVRLLGVAGYAVQPKRVETAGTMRNALAETQWDAVISDHNMPEFSSTAALQILKETGLDVPFIIVSGAIGEDIAVEAMIAGADDYILKSRLPRLVPALRRSLAAAATRRAERAAQARLRLLSSHMELVKEMERKSIAREIHDDIGGLLTGLAFDVSWLRNNASGDAMKERLNNMHGSLIQASANIERIMRELRPPILELGIVAALEWQAREYSRRYGTPCHFTTNRETVTMREASSTAMFRICQESLTNIARHAQAKSIRIEMFADQTSVVLEIADDGVGFSGEFQSKDGSYGLLGMRERATSLDGWLEVSSSPGRGTSVMLSLPLSTETGDSIEEGASA